MTTRHQRFTVLKQVNNLFMLDIDHVELLAHDFHQTLVFPRNILSFALEASPGDYYSDVMHGKTFPFRPGHLYFLPTGNTLRFGRSHSTLTVTLHFGLSLLPGVDLYSAADPCLMEYAPDAVERMRACLEMPPATAALQIRAEVFRFCARHPPVRMSMSEAMPDAYLKVLDHIRNHCDAKMTVRDLAKLIDMRQDVFSRSFKRAVGQSPHALIRQTLLRQIVDYLYSDLTLKEIATKMRFCSEFYLSRYFSQHFGISPREFRTNIAPVRKML